MNNIFIEGLQGSGKTTLLTMLKTALPQYHAYREGDLSPVDLAWCAYMKPKEYKLICKQYPSLINSLESHITYENGKIIIAYTKVITDHKDFHKQMEAYEIYDGKLTFNHFKKVIINRFKAFDGQGNLFECACFQNIIESLLLYYQMSDAEIIDFYREVFESLKDKSFKLIYIESSDVSHVVQTARRERIDQSGNEIWFNLMLAYLENSPYGKSQGIKGIEGLVRHLEHRQLLEIKIIKEVLGNCARVIQSRAFYFPDLIKWCEREGDDNGE